jgi:hypothetical protein
MNLDQIIKIISNRLEFLRSQRTTAVSVGDLEQVVALDSEIAESTATLNRLLTLVA